MVFSLTVLLGLATGPGSPAAHAADLPNLCLTTPSACVYLASAQGTDICKWGWICMYGNEDANLSRPGGVLMVNTNTLDPNRVSNLKPLGFNDVLSSYYNNTSLLGCIYFDSNYIRPMELVLQQRLVNVTDSFHKDQASSLYWPVGNGCVML